MKKNFILVLIVLLLILSSSSGLYGYALAKSNILPINKPKATLEYYLEEEQVEQMPSKTDEDNNPYEFARYTCDNNMILNFNSDTWSYTLVNESEGVCKLYFVRSDYLVELIATNGLINGEESSHSTRVVRGTDGQFNIIPSEGYEFDNVSCSNDKEAIYDISTNMLNINSITENVACQINFKKRVLKLEIVVKNGTGTTTEEKEYGESISAIVQPNDGFEKPKITCTNKQEFVYEDNKLTIQKLTDNSVCSVVFNKTPIITYSLIINSLPEQVTITAGNKLQSIVAGKDGKFSLKAQEGYSIILDCGGVKPSTENTDPDGSITYTFLGVNKNITCNVTPNQIDNTGN